MNRFVFALIVVGLVSIVSSAFACGFTTQGITSENLSVVKEALSKITSEFDFDLASGDLYFKSKEEVTLKQVQEALLAAKIRGVTVSAASHH